MTEILSQRSHVIDAMVPFLSPFRTFYIGLGTIASDLILLLVITGVLRKRFTADGKAWRWRAIHYSSYAAFVFGVLHGLLGGRAAKPYVDWSYGFAIAVTALGLAVRFLAISTAAEGEPELVAERRPGRRGQFGPDARRDPGHGAGPARRGRPDAAGRSGCGRPRQPHRCGRGRQRQHVDRHRASGTGPVSGFCLFRRWDRLRPAGRTRPTSDPPWLRILTRQHRTLTAWLRRLRRSRLHAAGRAAVG